MSKYYAVYKGDNIICHGTKKECAKFLGVTENTISFMTTSAHKKRNKGNRMDAFVVEDVKKEVKKK